MKTLKFKTQILIICCVLIAYGASALKRRIGSDGREYLIEYEHKYNWFQALHECARRDKQLLTIDSAEKQNVVSKLFQEGLYGYIWLGANDEFNPSCIVNRPFFWSATGRQFTYANWEKGNPNKIDDDRACVLIRLSVEKWVNFKCSDKNGYICEEKENLLLESFNKNSNNSADVVQKLTSDFDIKFLNLITDNISELNGRLESIEQMGKDTNYEVEKLTNITENAVQKILDKQELSTKELNHEITKQGSDLSDQLKRSVDELNGKLSEKQNFTNLTH